jgi:hypothetical protein
VEIVHVVGRADLGGGLELYPVNGLAWLRFGVPYWGHGMSG